MSPRLRDLASMGAASARSLLKVINERIAAIGRKFGTDSEAYKDAIAPLMSEKYAKYIGESKSGYVKINANVRRDWKDPDLLELVRTSRGSVQTIGRLKEAAREKLKEKYAEVGNFSYKPTETEIIEEIETQKRYNNEIRNLLDFMYEEHTDAENRELYPELYRGHDGTRPDYEVLDEIFERERKEREEWNRLNDKL